MRVLTSIFPPGRHHNVLNPNCDIFLAFMPQFMTRIAGVSRCKSCYGGLDLQLRRNAGESQLSRYAGGTLGELLRPESSHCAVQRELYWTDFCSVGMAHALQRRK